MYSLHDALRNKTIELQPFLRAIADAAHKQFKCRALASKICKTMQQQPQPGLHRPQAVRLSPERAMWDTTPPSSLAHRPAANTGFSMYPDL